MTKCACIDTGSIADATEWCCERRLTARKPATCGECGNTIPIGAQYSRWVGVWGGKMQHCVQCSACAEIAKAFFCGWVFGEVLSDLCDRLWDSDGRYDDEKVRALSPAAQDKFFHIVEVVWSQLDEGGRCS